MLVIEIDGKTYNLPMSWADVPIYVLEDAEQLRETTPTDITATDIETIRWITKYVSVFTGIPVDTLKKAIVSSEDEVSIIGLFNSLQWSFTYEAEIALKDTFEHNGVKYKLVEPKYDIFDSLIPMGHATFGQYEEASDIVKLMKDSKSFKQLSLFIAILYKPVKYKGWLFKKEITEEYDSNVAIQHGKLLRDMPASIALGALFFFIRLRILYIKNSLTSLGEATKEVEGSTSTAGSPSNAQLQKKVSLMQRGKLLCEVWKWRMYTRCLHTWTARKSKRKSMNLSGKKK